MTRPTRDTMTAPSVFISYSHDSPEHDARVLELSNRLRAEGIDATIDQYESSPAEGWPKWMDRRIEKSDFVLVVCTETYHRRVMGEEEKGRGLGAKWESTLTYQHIYDNDSLNMRFIPVLFADSKTEHIPTPLKGATYYHLPDQYEKLYRRLTNQPETIKPELGKLKSLPPRERKPDYLGAKVSLAKLPSTSPDLFGRKKELKALDDAWDNPNINVVSLVAWGGVGKTALVNKWLAGLGEEYCGAERVFGWSFYSQGAAEGRQVSADQLIAAALTWFGDPNPAAGSPWDKGERLAELIKQQRTLLIFDGLEPLQNPPPVETGKIKDPGLTSLLRELARQNPGLVVISTRLSVDDLKDCRGSTVLEIDLENLSPEAGAAYLEHLGVDGTEQERQDAARDFGGHALALTLMGGYLKVVHGGDIRKRREIPHLTDDQKQGAHARRVLGSYEGWLAGKPELDILRLMGLFDRPAEKGALDALRKEPAIAGLTDALQKLKDADWQFAVANLRDLRLLAAPEAEDPETLDCHPLLREHFGEKLKTENEKAWREGNNRLYEYYKTTAKPYPDTLQEMAPLFAAVLHGCQARRHQEAYDEVYRKRIRRGEEEFAFRKLGAIGSELAIISAFFDPPWLKVVGGLREQSKAYLLTSAGFDLRALGRLTEAAQAIQAGQENNIVRKDWMNAAIQASNLSELYLSIGDATRALAYAEQSVELADRSDDAFWRMCSHITLADALHQAGQLVEAEAAFREAEEMQKKNQPELPLLYSVQGFRYCDLLLSQGKAQEVARHSEKMFEWRQSGDSLLAIALDNLSLGRALSQTSEVLETSEVSQAITYLNRAVDGLRQAGQQTELPRGLLARAEYYRVTGALEKCQRDLDEAFGVASRGGMGLYLADCHLGFARLKVSKLASLKVEGANLQTLQPANLQTEIREHVRIAKKMIDEMGYHRRDGEVEELEEQLK
ncbi:MAG: SEFIR domain-containing protein [Anaerolineaceae bacterium]|nr:MAG: SEFIR domain-containing protein [Anaerolineaceae bacterium]